MSKGHACRLVHQPRGTQRYQPTQRNDEDALTRAINSLASQFGQYGYRRIIIKLQQAGWDVGKDSVEPILGTRRLVKLQSEAFGSIRPLLQGLPDYPPILEARGKDGLKEDHR